MQKNELIIVDQKERIKELLKEREEEKNQRGEIQIQKDLEPVDDGPKFADLY